MRPEFVALAHQAQRLAAEGDVAAAREKAEQCLNVLLNRDPAIGTFGVQLLPAAQIGVLTNHEVVIRIAGEERQLYVPIEILKATFTNTLERFEVIRKVCMTRSVLSVSEGQAIWDLNDTSMAGEYLRVAFCSNLENAYLVPDPYFLCGDAYGALRVTIRARWIPWHERRQIVFWRGVTTGQRLNTPDQGKAIQDWAWLQRLHLCDVASRSPHGKRLDIGVVESASGGFAQISEEFLAKAIKDANLHRLRCDKSEYINYRYVVDIDGNGNAWNGLFTAMLMGSTILKVASPFGFRQWYYDKLIPWENYIPVGRDLSDLDERVEWALSHPEQCAAMGRSIKALADQMTFETELQYAAEVVCQAAAGQSCSEPSDVAGGYDVRGIASGAGTTAVPLERASGDLDAGARSGDKQHGQAPDSQGTASELNIEGRNRMTPVQREILERLYDHDVWQRFEPGAMNAEVQGWNGDHPSLVRLASTGEGRRIVIDVGVWKGQSTITLARAMKDQGIDGCVIAVDTFLGSLEHWNHDGALFCRINGYPDLYRTFLGNVWHSGVADYVVPLPQTSSIAAQVLRRAGVTAHLIHLDASHNYEDVLQDTETYWELLSPGGYLIGDDYHETWPGVVRVAGEFSARVGCPLTIEPPKWILQKRF